MPSASGASWSSGVTGAGTPVMHSGTGRPNCRWPPGNRRCTTAGCSHKLTGSNRRKISALWVCSTLNGPDVAAHQSSNCLRHRAPQVLDVLVVPKVWSHHKNYYHCLKAPQEVLDVLVVRRVWGHRPPSLGAAPQSEPVGQEVVDDQPSPTPGHGSLRRSPPG